MKKKGEWKKEKNAKTLKQNVRGIFFSYSEEPKILENTSWHTFIALFCNIFCHLKSTPYQKLNKILAFMNFLQTKCFCFSGRGKLFHLWHVRPSFHPLVEAFQTPDWLVPSASLCLLKFSIGSPCNLVLCVLTWTLRLLKVSSSPFNHIFNLVHFIRGSRENGWRNGRRRNKER